MSARSTGGLVVLGVLCMLPGVAAEVPDAALPAGPKIER